MQITARKVMARQEVTNRKVLGSNPGYKKKNIVKSLLKRTCTIILQWNLCITHVRSIAKRSFLEWISLSPIIDRNSQKMALSKIYTAANITSQCFASGLLVDTINSNCNVQPIFRDQSNLNMKLANLFVILACHQPVLDGFN